MSSVASYGDLMMRVDEVVGRLEKLEKAVDELKHPLEIVYKFSPEEASAIAKEFAVVIKALSEAVTKLSEKGIGYESKFNAKDGALTVQLYKYEERVKEPEKSTH